MSDIKYTVLEMTPDHVIVAFKTPAGEWKIAKFLRVGLERHAATKLNSQWSDE